jgi:hypothetical protein
LGLAYEPVECNIAVEVVYLTLQLQLQLEKPHHTQVAVDSFAFPVPKSYHPVGTMDDSIVE